MALSLSKLPWHARLGAFAVVAIAGLAAFWKFYVQPFEAEMATRQATLATLQAEIAKGLATAQRLPEFRAQVADLEARLEDLRAVLPEQKDVGDLLRRIQTLATQSNVTIRGFTPQPINTKQTHAEWPNKLEVDGTYHNLGLFFDRISKVPRIINISRINIKAKDKPTDADTISADFVATTFVLMDDKGKAAVSPTSGRPGAAPASARASR